jgi:hypothetical protein
MYSLKLTGGRGRVTRIGLLLNQGQFPGHLTSPVNDTTTKSLYVTGQAKARIYA